MEGYYYFHLAGEKTEAQLGFLKVPELTFALVPSSPAGQLPPGW